MTEDIVSIQAFTTRDMPGKVSRPFCSGFPKHRARLISQQALP